MLAIDGLQVAYGDLQVVWSVSFAVPDRAIVSLIGPNGAGKTTILRAIMGLLPLKAGDVSYRGRSLAQLRTHQIVEHGLVMIPEDRAAFASLTVAENLELGAYPKRARAYRDETMEEVFATFPVLAKRRRQQAATLSGGERRMLAIGKAMMAKPDLLILDEPSLGLAPLIVETTFEAIKEIRSSNVAVLLVEQHVEMAMEVSDHVYIIEQGIVVGNGTPTELSQDTRVRDAYLSL